MSLFLFYFSSVVYFFLYFLYFCDWSPFQLSLWVSCIWWTAVFGSDQPRWTDRSQLQGEGGEEKILGRQIQNIYLVYFCMYLELDVRIKARNKEEKNLHILWLPAKLFVNVKKLANLLYGEDEAIIDYKHCQFLKIKTVDRFHFCSLMSLDILICSPAVLKARGWDAAWEFGWNANSSCTSCSGNGGFSLVDRRRRLDQSGARILSDRSVGFGLQAVRHLQPACTSLLHSANCLLVANYR